MEIFYKFLNYLLELHIKCGPERIVLVARSRNVVVTIARVTGAIVVSATPTSARESIRAIGVSRVFCCPFISI